ncbi:716_t:CDS:2, partial [Racocetra persica]
GPNDGGVDIICDIRGIKLIIQCKNWTNSIGPAIVRELKGVVGEEPGSIGILVAPFMDFTDEAIKSARTSRFPIIFTDVSHLQKIILHLAVDSLYRKPRRRFNFTFYYDLSTH